VAESPVCLARRLFSLAIPVGIGISGIMGVILFALISVVPAIILAYIVVFRLIPPRYERAERSLSLFDR